MDKEECLAELRRLQARQAAITQQIQELLDDLDLNSDRRNKVLDALAEAEPVPRPKAPPAWAVPLLKSSSSSAEKSRSWKQ